MLPNLEPKLQSLHIWKEGERGERNRDKLDYVQTWNRRREFII